VAGPLLERGGGHSGGGTVGDARVPHVVKRPHAALDRGLSQREPERRAVPGEVERRPMVGEQKTRSSLPEYGDLARWSNSSSAAGWLSSMVLNPDASFAMVISCLPLVDAARFAMKASLDRGFRVEIELSMDNWSRSAAAQDRTALVRSRPERSRMSRFKFLPVLLVLALALAAPSMAARSGGKNAALAASCTVSGNVVSAVGLPTGQLINFMMTDSSGTSGWVLGSTSDGTWSLTVPTASGSATYQFVSSTWGPSGSKYTVFASC
jgi:hypothetical protein